MAEDRRGRDRSEQWQQWSSRQCGSYSITLAGSTATVTLSGLSRDNSQMGTLVDGLGYRNTSDNPGSNSRVVTITQINDNGSSSNSANPGLASSVALTPVNDAPSVTTAGGTTPFTEGTPTAIDSGLTLSDVDSSTLASATVAITGNFQSGQDLLAFTNNGSTMGNISASYNSGTGVLSLTSAGATATLAQWQAALRAVTYANSSENPNTSAPHRQLHRQRRYRRQQRRHQGRQRGHR